MPAQSAAKAVTGDPAWLGPAVRPGEMLLEEFIEALGWTQVEAAARWYATLAGNLTRWFAIVGEVGAGYRNDLRGLVEVVAAFGARWAASGAATASSVAPVFHLGHGQAVLAGRLRDRRFTLQDADDQRHPPLGRPPFNAPRDFWNRDHPPAGSFEHGLRVAVTQRGAGQQLDVSSGRSDRTIASASPASRREPEPLRGARTRICKAGPGGRTTSPHPETARTWRWRSLS